MTTTTAMTVKFPTVETVRIGADTLRSEEAVKQKWVKFTDMLRADGVTSAMLSKHGSEELRDFVRNSIIIPSFKKEIVALIEKDISEVPENMREARRRARMQIGSKLAKIESHLRDAEEKEKKVVESGPVEGEDGTPKTSKTDAQKLQKLLDDILTKIGKMEEPTFDVVAVCDHLKAAKSIIPSV
jgi:hypothetical protein